MKNAPLRSMTGYGDAERQSDRASIRAEIRTVNHRYLNFQFRLPPGLDRHQQELEKALKDHFVRGHVKVAVTAEPGPALGGPTVQVDVDRARSYLDGLRELKRELEVEGEVDLALLAGFRDLYRMEEEDPELRELEVEEIREVLEAAARKVTAMREEEGARLASDMRARLDAMEMELDGIEERAPHRLVEERDRLREAVRELLQGESAQVDEERIHREIAHLAERWDIHEEVVRFRSHVRMFRDALAAGDPDGVGKRFGFIAQELLREANTLGSKANDAEIAARVVALKEEIERLREQLENVE